MSPLATLTDPYLGLFRGIIPPLGGTIDLSPILAFVTLDLLTSSAAALPCEMPTTATEEGGGAKGGGSEKGGAGASAGPPSRGGQVGRSEPRRCRQEAPLLAAAAVREERERERETRNERVSEREKVVIFFFRFFM